MESEKKVVQFPMYSVQEAHYVNWALALAGAVLARDLGRSELAIETLKGDLEENGGFEFHNQLIRRFSDLVKVAFPDQVHIRTKSAPYTSTPIEELKKVLDEAYAARCAAGVHCSCSDPVCCLCGNIKL